MPSGVLPLAPKSTDPPKFNGKPVNEAVNGERSVRVQIQQGLLQLFPKRAKPNEPQSTEQKVEFGTSYSTPPRVAVGIRELDIDFLQAPPNVSVEVKDITKSGFTLVTQTESAAIWSLHISWLAIPSEGKFKDIHVMTFDTRKGQNSVSDFEGKRTITQPFTFEDLVASKYSRAPTAVTWLSGLQLRQSPSIQSSTFRLRGYTAKLDKTSCAVAVETNQAAAFGGAQFNFLFIAKDSPLAANYINPEDTLVVKPIANETSFDYRSSNDVDPSKALQTVIALEGWDFSTVGGSSIRCTVKTNEEPDLKSVGGWRATQACWYDCKVNAIWSWAVTSEM